MAEDALQFLVRNVQNLVVDHYHSVSGAGKELHLLSGELKAMIELLSERAGHPMFTLKQYERDVRDAAHEAEDILDECHTRAALKYSKKSLTKYFSPKYRKLAKKVESFRRTTIKPLFDKISQVPVPPNSQSLAASQPNHHHITHQITPSTEEHIIRYEGEPSTNYMLPTNGITLSAEGNIVRVKGEASTSTQFASEKLNHETRNDPRPRPRRGTVVGFEKEAETIIELLSSSDEKSVQLEVISIIGMPGLGKTTLARKIYEDERIKREFPRIIWVDVSQNYEKRKVFLSILKSLTNTKYYEVADDMLSTAIKVCLKDQKFLLFLDDVWQQEEWVDIEAALPVDNKLGRVVITSRSWSVGGSAKRSWEPRGLGFLDERKSWELLQLQVFNDLDDCPRDLIEHGRSIAQGCGGVPLAIVVIGGILSKINSTSEESERTNQWEKVSNNVVKYVHDKDKARTRKIIAWSYNLLPLELKYCFLYLGIFPESSHIPIQRLIRMWIAEGFIWKKSHMSLEEVAYDYLKDLIDRNLVIVDGADRKPDGYIKTCRVHDFIREFCKNEASLDNHNLFQEMELSSTGEGTFHPPVSEIGTRRRICIHSHVEDFLSRQPKGPRVHSFLCFAKEAVSSLPPDTSPIPLNFDRLRVLDVNPIKLSKFPSKLPELIHLRYISLSADGKDFKLLPKDISDLWNLQSITIETKWQTFEIKANLWKMMHLRHLKTKAAIILQNKLDGEAGDTLQSLSRLSAQCSTHEVFSKAKNLHNLGIRGDLNSIPDTSCFKQLKLLQKLKLVHDVYPKAASDKPLRALPDHSHYPLSLNNLQLSGTALQWNQIQTLEKLPGLKVLKLKNNAFVGKRWKADQGCFSSLDILVIAENELVNWTASETYFPKLGCLVLKDCKELEEIPFQLTENLRLMHVERISKSAVVSARKIDAEKQRARGNQNGKRLEFQLIIDSTGAR